MKVRQKVWLVLFRNVLFELSDFFANVRCRVTTIWHFGFPSFRVVERAEVLPETSDDSRNFVISFH